MQAGCPWQLMRACQFPCEPTHHVVWAAVWGLLHCSSMPSTSVANVFRERLHSGLADRHSALTVSTFAASYTATICVLMQFKFKTADWQQKHLVETLVYSWHAFYFIFWPHSVHFNAIENIKIILHCTDKLMNIWRQFNLLTCTWTLHMKLVMIVLFATDIHVFITTSDMYAEMKAQYRIAANYCF